MAECKNVETKYIKHYEAGLIIRIERAGTIFKKKMPYRKHGGYERTWVAARKLRDEQHELLFGTPVTKRFFHIKNKSKSGNLPPGLSYGYSRGKLLYIVVSYCEQPGEVKRKRFNINKLGLSQAIKDGMEFRFSVMDSI